ncbi:hypothetical protein CONCODRAFT_84079 [Conidiobolus coronatus NRRL 28638]|uniref:Zinc-ribbon domain-containing protein n=1 Tax=Conidiobolus coronatus (strain ATCC 28846 / CBS 209.66 / NRRL 28638) TaxID=796925 RepID=A0A137PBG2_CONC2|nr:hypothetical protein CONCODRAFT_84079 [Conidiobolus coronatus NRRL 28638]|eukprot:KXN72359.1 hypothetical protein CONCODRAFT_84079 [Conidiobolus coronatus NRRL 28638]
MKQLIKLMEYKFCNKCKLEIKDNKKFCKNCQPKVNKTKKYYSYKFRNSQLVRIGQDINSTSTTSKKPSSPESRIIPAKLKIIYYTNPLDINLMSQVQYSKFTNFQSLNYLSESNSITDG